MAPLCHHTGLKLVSKAAHNNDAASSAAGSPVESEGLVAADVRVLCNFLFPRGVSVPCSTAYIP